MPAIDCPYCGAIMNMPLKFCLACGHAVSETDLRKYGGIKTAMRGGVTKRLDENLSHSSFERVKKNYFIVRSVREALWMLAIFLGSLLIFFFALKTFMEAYGKKHLLPKIYHHQYHRPDEQRPSR